MTLLAQLPPETGKVIEKATSHSWETGMVVVLLVVCLGIVLSIVGAFGLVLRWMMKTAAERDQLANRRDEQRSQEAQNRESGYTLRLVGVEEFCRTKLLATTEECAQALVKSSDANRIMSDALAASNAATVHLSTLVKELSGKQGELLDAVISMVGRISEKPTDTKG